MMLRIFHFLLDIFALRELHRVLVGKSEGKRRCEEMVVGLYALLLP
jgi:hypothetical protein